MEQLNNPSIEERRIAPRSASAMRAYLLIPAGGLLPGVVRNLSRSGLFLQTKIPANPSVGDSATIVFAVEDGNIVRLLRYSVVVRRESHQGYGLEFGRCLWSTGIFRRS